MPTADYTLYIDWGNDGSFGAADDMSSRLRASPGASFVRGKDQIRALAPPMAGRWDADLDNVDRELSIENSTSALYGNLLPGRKLQLQGVVSGSTYYLWTGYLDDVPQKASRQERAVAVPALGPLSRLAGKKVSTALYQSITTDTAIGYVLDAVGWAAGDRVLDTGKSTLNWWWLQEEDAFTALQTLINTEGPGAVLYEDGRGRIVFESRHYRMTTTRSNTSQATLRDTGTEPLYGNVFSFNPGLKDIVNVAKVTVKIRAAAGGYSVVWSLGESVTLAANEVRTYTATDASNPFTDAQTPAAATDYTLTAGSLTIILDRTSGQSCTLTVTAGALGASFSGLQLRAKSVTVSNTIIVANTIDTTTSQNNYGQQIWSGTTLAEIDVGVAQDMTNAIVSRYQSPRPTVTFAVNNGSTDRLTQIVTREISDRITVVEAQTGVNHDYWIERIGHRIGEAGKHHVTELGCEKVVSAQYFILGTSLLDTGVLGY